MKITQERANKLLIEAIKQGEIDTVKYLLNNSPVKADLHIINEAEDPEYCLYLAAQYNQLPILKFFLEETELKEYTKQKGIKQFVASNLYDTLNIMYEYAGQNGNKELIDYLVEKLPLENKFQLFANAALCNHVHIMDYMLKTNMLTDDDKNALGKINNNAIEWSIKHNAREAFEYLMNYYKKTPYKKVFNSIEFKVSGLLKVVESIKEDTNDFTMFNVFYNNKEVQENYELLKKTMFYNRLAGKNNLPLYKKVIEEIKDKKIKKQIVLESYIEAIEDSGSINDYPVYKYVLDTYPFYFNKEEKENIFIALIYNKNPEDRFQELINYSFLTKAVNPNNILKQAFKNIYIEDTYLYIKEILSEFNTKIKMSHDNYYYFKQMYKLNTDEAIDMLKTIINNYPEVKIEKVEHFFDDIQVQSFLNKWKLHEKLNSTLTEKNKSIKKIKI